MKKSTLTLIGLLAITSLSVIAEPITENSDSTTYRLNGSISPSSAGGSGFMNELEGKVVSYAYNPGGANCPAYNYSGSARVVNGIPEMIVSSTFIGSTGARFVPWDTGWQVGTSLSRSVNGGGSEHWKLSRDAGGWYLSNSASAAFGKCPATGGGSKKYFQ
ncbi:MAG: hypothetical protein CTY35_00295 [Methylotenera sp.]|uniref:hypothetical protein n=1 Tax=Methylotenera sp. TaxID=2051956 RepID=UPI000D4928C8|nr:hypothetical protein [Methylotenera sp.]PPC84795.1 MAG: hypothetical protein CTY38_00295 [Methylotenera sp.]PPD02154.1 MAG: hypothetical protein CTY35_00295 [Methylotenera sp.]